MWVNSKIDLAPINKILHNHGLNEGGPVQTFFTNNVKRKTVKYMPGGASGSLAGLTILGSNNESIITAGPYAQYLYHGKLMVDPKYGKGAFFSPNFGYWSRKYVKKVLTDIPLNYHTPGTGPFWDNKMWAVEGKQVVKETQKFVDRG